MIPNQRVDDNGNVLLNRGTGKQPGVWLFDEFWIDDSSCCSATVRYEATWDSELKTFTISDPEVSEISFFDDDGEDLEVGPKQQPFVDQCKKNILDHFMDSCIDDVIGFEMGELA